MRIGAGLGEAGACAAADPFRPRANAHRMTSRRMSMGRNDSTPTPAIPVRRVHGERLVAFSSYGPAAQLQLPTRTI